MKKKLFIVMGIMLLSGLFLVAVQANGATLDKANVIESAEQTAEEVKGEALEATEEIKEEAGEELKEATDEAEEAAVEPADNTEDTEEAKDEAGAK